MNIDLSGIDFTKVSKIVEDGERSLKKKRPVEDTLDLAVSDAYKQRKKSMEGCCSFGVGDNRRYVVMKPRETSVNKVAGLFGKFSI